MQMYCFQENSRNINGKMPWQWTSYHGATDVMRISWIIWLLRNCYISWYPPLGKEMWKKWKSMVKTFRWISILRFFARCFSLFFLLLSSWPTFHLFLNASENDACFLCAHTRKHSCWRRMLQTKYRICFRNKCCMCVITETLGKQCYLNNISAIVLSRF